ncbi:MAG: thermonuclease [Actinobacteria bacterium]|nr:thermonuclease [Actinomycetota bacterium]
MRYLKLGINTLLLILFNVIVFSCGLNKDKPNISEFDVSSYLEKDRKKIYQVSEIIDGDTYKIIIDKFEFKVRLIGVDTPEASRSFKTKSDAKRKGVKSNQIIEIGKIATLFLKNYISEGDSIRLELDIQKFDRYGRILAYVYLMNGEMINEILLKEGYAQVMTIPPNIKYQDKFMLLQQYAIENSKGLWSLNHY